MDLSKRTQGCVRPQVFARKDACGPRYSHARMRAAPGIRHARMRAAPGIRHARMRAAPGIRAQRCVRPQVIHVVDDGGEKKWLAKSRKKSARGRRRSRSWVMSW